MHHHIKFVSQNAELFRTYLPGNAWTHRQADTRTHTQTGRHTDRWTHRQVDTRTQTQTGGHPDRQANTDRWSHRQVDTRTKRQANRGTGTHTDTMIPVHPPP